LVDEAEAKTSKRAKRKAQSKQNNGKNFVGGDGSETITGAAYGKADVVASAKPQKIDLGKGKYVTLYVPENVADVKDSSASSLSLETLQRFKDDLYGAGDVVWPASVALARLLVHCPSLVHGKKVLEIGAGLGLAGNASLRSGASKVKMCDIDSEVLQLAKMSAVENRPGDPSVASIEVLDWTSIPESFCAAPAGRSDVHSHTYDVVIAADVLYDEQSAKCVAEVMSRCLVSGGMALVCDPERRQHRRAFAKFALGRGLETADAEFPGHSDMRLLQCTRVDVFKAG
jgi:predicted nicotinamide N-methyase